MKFSSEYWTNFVQYWKICPSCWGAWKGEQQLTPVQHQGRAASRGRHAESWEFGCSPSCQQHAAALPRTHLLGEQEGKQPPPSHPGTAQNARKGLSVCPSLPHPAPLLAAPHSLVGTPAKRVRHGRRKRQRISACPMGQTDDATWAEEKPSKAQQSAARGSSQLCASVSPSME